MFLRFSPDGKSLAVGSWEWVITLWDWERGQPRQLPLPLSRSPQGPDSSFHASFSPDGKWLAASSGLNADLGIYEAASGRETHRFRCSAIASSFTPDSKRLAVSNIKVDDQGVRERTLLFFDLADGKQVARFPLNREETCYSLVFSPDGKTLACGRSDWVSLLDCVTGRELRRLPMPTSWPAFSADGRTLATCSGRRLCFWDVATGKGLHDLPGQLARPWPSARTGGCWRLAAGSTTPSASGMRRTGGCSASYR